MKVFSSKYYLRLITFSLLISTLPVIFVGLFSYYSASRMIQKKVDEGNTQILLQTEMQVEQSLKQVENSTLQLLLYKNGITLNNSSYAFGKLSIAENYNDIQDTINELNSLSNESIRVEDAALINLKEDYAISTRGYFILDEITEKGQFQDFFKSSRYSYWSIWNSFLIRSAVSLDSVPNPGIVLVKKLLPLNNLNAEAFILVKISGSEFNKFIVGRQFGDVMILDQDNHIIACKNNELLGKDLSASTHVKKIGELQNEKGQFMTNLDGAVYQINFLKSDYNGWIYISTVPVASITKDSRMIGWATFFTCIGIILLIIVISYFGSKRIYSPINKFYESVFGETEQVGTNKTRDEMEYLDERIRGLLNERKQMRKQWQSHREQYREYYIIKLLQGEVKNEGIREKLLSFEYEVNWKQICILVLEVDTVEDTPFKDDDENLLMFSMDNIICELIPAGNRLNPVIIKKNMVIILGNEHDSDEAFKSHVIAQAGMIQKTIKQYLQVSISIGISEPYNEFSRTNKAYMEAHEALRHKLYLGKEAIICFKDIRVLQNSKRVFPKDLEEALLYAIKCHDVNKADRLLHEFIMEVFKEKQCYQEYQISIARLMMDIIRMMEDLNIPLLMLFHQHNFLFEALSGLKNQQEIVQWLRDSVVFPLMEAIAEQQKLVNKKISDEIIDMIHDQYDNDFNLELCAERLNYNSKYISRVFKEETGVSFSEYLAKYRLKIAKKMLKDTDIKIGDIASKLKYQNAQNFIRYFKKYEGVTPGQYRDNDQ